MLLPNGNSTKHEDISNTSPNDMKNDTTCVGIVEIKGNFLNVFLKDKRQLILILLIYSKVFISYKMIYMHFELEVKLQVRC